MKKSGLLFCFFVVIVLTASAQQNYRMYEMSYMTVKAGQEKAFEKAIAAHNKKFHAQAPYKVIIAQVEVGTHTGEYTWVMGPLTFTDLDGRPADDQHDADWSATVIPYLEDHSGEDYWKIDEKLSFSTPDAANSERRMITYYDIAPGKMFRFEELVKKVVKVYQDKKYKDNFIYMHNAFSTGNNRDVMIVTFFDKYSYFDSENPMVKDFEEIYGQGSWSQFLAEYDEIVVSSTDEIRRRRADLSSSN